MQFNAHRGLSPRETRLWVIFFFSIIGPTLLASEKHLSLEMIANKVCGGSL